MRPRDAPGSANRRPRKAGGERPDGARPAHAAPRRTRSQRLAPAAAVALGPPPPPAVGTHVQVKDDAAVRGVVSILGRKGTTLDVRTTSHTVLPLRKAQLLPTELTPEQAAFCSRPLTPKEYLQAQLDGALTVRYAVKVLGELLPGGRRYAAAPVRGFGGWWGPMCALRRRG